MTLGHGSLKISKIQHKKHLIKLNFMKSKIFVFKRNFEKRTGSYSLGEKHVLNKELIQPNNKEISIPIKKRRGAI